MGNCAGCIKTDKPIHNDVLGRFENYIDNNFSQDWFGRTVSLRLLNLAAAGFVAPVNALYNAVKLPAQIGVYLTIKPLVHIAATITESKKISRFETDKLPNGFSICSTLLRIASSIMSIFSRALGILTPNLSNTQTKQQTATSPTDVAAAKKATELAEEEAALDEAIAADAENNKDNSVDIEVDQESSESDFLSLFLNESDSSISESAEIDEDPEEFDDIENVDHSNTLEETSSIAVESLPDDEATIEVARSSSQSVKEDVSMSRISQTEDLGQTDDSVYPFYETARNSIFSKSESLNIIL